MSLPPNWNHEGQAEQDSSRRHVHAPQSAIEIHGRKVPATPLVIGHPLSLCFQQHAAGSRGQRVAAEQSGSRTIEVTALPLPRARRITGRRLRTDEPLF